MLLPFPLAAAGHMWVQPTIAYPLKFLPKETRPGRHHLWSLHWQGVFLWEGGAESCGGGWPALAWRGTPAGACTFLIVVFRGIYMPLAGWAGSFADWLLHAVYSLDDVLIYAGWHACTERKLSVSNFLVAFRSLSGDHCLLCLHFLFVSWVPLDCMWDWRLS